jgi:hypothetical protein
MLIKISKICLGALLLSSLLHSVEEVAVPKIDPLANWWEKSSYEYPETDKLLMHVEGTGRYATTSGNDEKEEIIANVTGKVRKGHFGGTLSYTKTFRDEKLFDDKSDTTPAHIEVDEYEVSFVGGYDINKDFYINAGYLNGRNILFEVYNQTTMYLGLGYRLLTTDAHRLSVFAAKGSEDISFGTYPQLPSGKADGYYYQIDYTWMINPTISWTSMYSYLKLDVENRNTSLLTSQLTVRATENISFLVGYRDEYMEAQKTVNRYTNDKNIYTALKFEY